MLLLGPVADSGIDAFMKQPDEVGGAETQSCYLVVDDIAAHRARTRQPAPKLSSICGTSPTAVADIPAAIRKAIFGTSVPTCPAKFHAAHRRAVAVSALAIALLGTGIVLGFDRWSAVKPQPPRAGCRRSHHDECCHILVDSADAQRI